MRDSWDRATDGEIGARCWHVALIVIIDGTTKEVEDYHR